MEYYFLQTFCFILLWQQSMALYLPNRKLLKLKSLSAKHDKHLNSDLVFYGRDRRTHKVGRDLKTFSDNSLPNVLQNKILSKNSVSYDSQAPHKRVAKDTRTLVISSVVVQDTKGNDIKKWLVFRDGDRKVIEKKPKRGSKFNMFWG